MRKYSLQWLLIALMSVCCCTRISAQQRTDSKLMLSADSALMQYLRGEGLVSYLGHSIQFFTNGRDKFDALIRDIDNAHERIWIEYFIFANDSIGTLVMNHLVDAAQRGCDVRVVTDYYKDRERHFGMGKPAYADSLAQLGVDFQMFDRFKILWFNHVARDHRKIVNIDDHIGYIGGLNIADYYINGSPDYGGWRDIHARIKGPAVEGLAQLFHKQYVASGGQREYSFSVPSPTSASVSSSVKASVLSSVTASVSSSPEISSAEVVYFERSRESRQKKAETRNALIAALDAAHDTIRIVSPYLMPTHTVRQALIRALDRGVHMEVLFSKVGDIEMISAGNYHFCQKLLRHGAEVYLYKGEFHHSKIMMIDNLLCMVGSANLNSRSLKWDYEASAFLFGATATQELTSIFQQDKIHSDTLTQSYYKKNYSFGFRLKGWFSDRFLTPIL